MSWPYEHWDNGKVYLHNERWEEFRKNIDKYGYNGSKHDWDHTRIFLNIHTPRKILEDIPIRGDDNLKHNISSIIKGYSVIYEPFPAFVRTEHDPEGWLPSWNLYLEDNHNKKEKLEELTILETDHIFAVPESKWTILIGKRDTNLFAFFREHYWIVTGFKNYQTGHCPPEKKKKKKKYRSLFDE